jgi:hypothetical protein
MIALDLTEGFAHYAEEPTPERWSRFDALCDAERDAFPQRWPIDLSGEPHRTNHVDRYTERAVQAKSNAQEFIDRTSPLVVSAMRKCMGGRGRSPSENGERLTYAERAALDIWLDLRVSRLADILVGELAR